MTELKQEQMTDVIPNEAGLPCNRKDSEKVARGLKKWKAIRKKKMTPKGKTMSYWQIKSSFSAL